MMELWGVGERRDTWIWGVQAEMQVSTFSTGETIHCHSTHLNFLRDGYQIGSRDGGEFISA
jgi:hypothetical protein